MRLPASSGAGAGVPASKSEAADGVELVPDADPQAI
jgi:hypothetical protein